MGISKDIFENENKIAKIRAKYYSNPETGKYFRDRSFWAEVEWLIMFIACSFFFPGAANPTYLKENGDVLVTVLAFGGMFFGISCIVRGMYNMAHGIGKVQG